MITTFTFVLFPLQTAGCHIGVEEKGRGGGSQTICLERIWSDFFKVQLPSSSPNPIK